MNEGTLDEKVEFLKVGLKMNNQNDNNKKFIKRLLNELNDLLLKFFETKDDKTLLVIRTLITVLNHLTQTTNFDYKEKDEYCYKQTLIIIELTKMIKEYLFTCFEPTLSDLKQNITAIDFIQITNHSKDSILKNKFLSNLTELEVEIEKLKKIGKNGNCPIVSEEELESVERYTYYFIKCIESIENNDPELYYYLHILKQFENKYPINGEIAKRTSDLLSSTNITPAQGVILEEIKLLLIGKSKTLNPKIVLKKYDIDTKEATKALISLPGNFRERVLDTRDVKAITIDPAISFCSKDDALSIRKIGEEYILGIHITDAGGFIRRNSPFDLYTRKKYKTLYLPDSIIKSIPDSLSKEKLSMESNQQRNSISLYLVISSNGMIKDTFFANDNITIKSNLTYDGADKIMLNKRKTELQQLLSTLTEISYILGDITKEKEIYRDIKDLERERDGNPEYNLLSHKIVQECMIAYNRYFAQKMAYERVPMIYRVHQKPSVSGIETELSLSGDISLLDQYPRAYYSKNNIGHFGLHELFYSHSSSPLRRYPDLYNQFLYHAFIEKDMDSKECEELTREIESIINYFNTKEKELKIFEIEYNESYSKSLRRY